MTLPLEIVAADTIPEQSTSPSAEMLSNLENIKFVIWDTNPFMTD
jgi:hypothetical protein